MISLALVMGLACSGTTKAADKSLILIMGDSISAAYNMEQAESWPALLSMRLEQDGYDYQVFNSSITGDTTEGGLSRLPRLLANQQPAVVIIELGGNDGLRGLSLEVTRNNLQQMLTLSQQAGAHLVLAGIQLPPNYGQTYTERFSRMFVELAEENSAALIPFILQDIALNPALMQDDGIHPNVQAQPALLDLVWAALQPLLKQ